MSKKQPLIHQHKDFVVFLNSLSPRKRKEFLKVIKGVHVNCISEIFANFLKKNLTEDKAAINKLRKYRKDIKSVALKKYPKLKKLKILTSQRGGAILSVLLPIAAGLIGKLISG